MGGVALTGPFIASEFETFIHFLYLVRTIASEQNYVYAGSLDGETRKLVTRADSLIGVARSSLLYVRDGAIYAAPFDEKKLELNGTSRRVVDGAAYFEAAAHSFASVSSDGALLYVPVSVLENKRSVGWYDRSGRLTERLFTETEIYAVQPSPDGTRVAVLKCDPKRGKYDIVTMDLSRRIPTEITGGLQNHNSMVWSPAGTELYFSSDRDGMYDIYATSDDGTAQPRKLWQSSEDKLASSVTPDGAFLVCMRNDPKTRQDIWLVPLRGGQPAVLIGTEAQDYGARVSPNGRFLAYVSELSGKREVHVRRFPNGRSIQVSTDGGADPSWRHDSGEIFFYNEQKRWGVTLRADGDVPRLGKPVLLFEDGRTVIDVWPSPIDDRFLINTDAEPADHPYLFHYLSKWK